MVKAIFLAMISLLFIPSCLEDLGNDSVVTEIIVSFESGPYAGQTFQFTSSQANDVLNYYTSSNRTRVFCSSLESSDGRSLNVNSSINFAWTGNPQTGTFLSLNFGSPGLPNSGDIDIDFQDGELFTANIPANMDVVISAYGAVDEAVEGQMSFNTTLYREKSGQSSSISTRCNMTFSIKRGADKN